MAGRDGKKQTPKATAGRRLLVGMGASAGVFLAAAAMATSSAAPAKADFDDLIDPIIQPLLTSFTDSLSAFDPAAALDLTTWTDNLLAGLGSVDLALPSVAEPAAAATSSSVDAAALTGGTIPITIAEGTEPTVGATVDGASTTLLVDTGSSGLVIPDTDLGDTSIWQVLQDYGFPDGGIGSSGFSGGVHYIYFTYDNLPVNYDGGIDTTAPVEVEVYSYEPGNFASLFTNDAFQKFDASNDVTGVLGIGNDVSGGAGESPLEAAGYNGVTVDLVNDKLIVGDSNPYPTGAVELTGSGSTVSGLTETVTTSGGTQVGAHTVSDDLDSGGVYGTIPSSISSSTLAHGDVVTVSDNGHVLYSYTVGTGESPTVVSGTSIDSGVEPFFTHPLYIDYSTDKLYLDS